VTLRWGAAIRGAAERGLRMALEPATKTFARWRVHPNILSSTGFVLTCVSGYLFSQHRISTAGIVMLAGGAFDLFDGTVARRTGRASSFGAFFDSTLDRASEIAVYIGLMVLFSDLGLAFVGIRASVWVVAGLAGSLMISYTRARAEALGMKCAVGLMQRAERVILVGGVAAVIGAAPAAGSPGIILGWTIVVLAVLAILTAAQRVAWIYRITRPDGEPRPGADD